MSKPYKTTDYVYTRYFVAPNFSASSYGRIVKVQKATKGMTVEETRYQLKFRNGTLGWFTHSDLMTSL